MSKDIFDLSELTADFEFDLTDVQFDVYGNLYGKVTANLSYKPDSRIGPSRNPNSSVNDLIKLFVITDGICVVTFVDRVHKKAIQLSRSGSGKIELSVVTLPTS